MQEIAQWVVLPTKDKQTLSLSHASHIMGAYYDTDLVKLVVWFITQPTARKISRDFVLRETTDSIEDNATYVCTFLGTPFGAPLHLFELLQPPQVANSIEFEGFTFTSTEKRLLRKLSYVGINTLYDLRKPSVSLAAVVEHGLSMGEIKKAFQLLAKVEATVLHVIDPIYKDQYAT